MTEKKLGTNAYGGQRSWMQVSSADGSQAGKGILPLQCFCRMQRHLQRQYCGSLRQLNLKHMVNSATELVGIAVIGSLKCARRQSAAVWRQQNTCKHSAAAVSTTWQRQNWQFAAALGGFTAAYTVARSCLPLIDAPTDPAHLYGRFNPGFSIFFSLSFELDIRSNNQTSSHYREHTRQQHGWTVLAPGPPAGPELPPPYTPEAAPQPTSAAATTAGGVTLAFDVPVNSNIIDVPFAVGYTKICKMMGLDPATACVGFKWDNERANVATHALSTKADWDNCLETGIGLTRRARSRNVVCKIRNLNLPTETEYCAIFQAEYGLKKWEYGVKEWNRVLACVE
ncbi:hypothetical protein B0H14DRAFT_2637503 [Mycena olivaceomarginata]|nr:hypothetical protein B0H14DRAFT_2637503 [Mycena olivaceomarginata]